MNKNKINMLYLINFLAIAGINMTNPLIANIIVELGFPTFMFGIFFAIFSISNFLFSPFWGKTVDKNGRKKVILIGLLGYSCSHVMLGFSNSSIIVIVFRFLAGIFMCAYIISSMAHLIDITTVEDRPKYIARYSAFSTLGTSVGSLIGGFIGDFHYRYTFVVQFIWIIIVLIVAKFVIEDKFQVKENQLDLIKEKNIIIISREVKEKINIMMFSIMLISFAITSYNSSITYYLETVFELEPSKIGMFLSMTGVISLIINFIVSPFLLKIIRQEVMFVLSSFFAGLSMLMAVISKSIFICIVWIIFYLAFSNLNMPLQQSIISNISDNSKGKILGIQYSVRSAGMIFGSLCAGFVFDINNKLPFIICAFIFSMVGMILSLKKCVFIKNNSY